MTTVVFVNNIKCGGCENQITSTLDQIKGIGNTVVFAQEGKVTFEFSNEEARAEALAKLDKMGYPLITKENRLSDQAKSLVSCAIGRIKK